MKTVDGRLICIAGASRSGKTAWTRKATAADRRIFAWDIEDQWAALPGWQRITSAADLARLAATPGPQKVAFVCQGDPRRAFEHFAACMFASIDRIGPATIIAEELADVTNPAKAPAAWGMLCRRGLKRCANIYAISQRWAEADKTALGNASAIIVFRQSSQDDVRYLTRKTTIAAETIAGLDNLEFVAYDCASQQTKAGKLRF